VPGFTVAAGAAIAIGIGLWFIERHPAFRAWRPLIRYALLGMVLAALVATVAWDIARQAGR
jgi:hypothetical protein